VLAASLRLAALAAGAVAPMSVALDCSAVDGVSAVFHADEEPD
jgi:hypothetical protein